MVSWEFPEAEFTRLRGSLLPGESNKAVETLFRHEFDRLTAARDKGEFTGSYERYMLKLHHLKLGVYDGWMEAPNPLDESE